MGRWVPDVNDYHYCIIDCDGFKKKIRFEQENKIIIVVYFLFFYFFFDIL